MKKLLIATLALTAFAGFAPSASAGHRDEVFVGYDRRGRPVYREVYHSSRRYDERPVYHRETRQVRSRHADDHDRRPEPRRQHRSPLAFLFGF